MSAKSRAVWVFAVAALAALAVQSLLIVEGQCHRLESALLEDFRVVFFLHAPIEDAKRAVIEEKIRADPDAAEVRYVSPEQALSALKREDSDLVDSIAFVGNNPLPGGFEIRPSAEALPRLAAWIESLQAVGAWSDVRWKPAQLQAILRARLYAHWLRLVLSTMICGAAGLALWMLWISLHGHARDRRLIWAGALGGVAGLAIAALFAWPLRRDLLLWVWPPVWTQAVVVASCAVLGGCLSIWRTEA